MKSPEFKNEIVVERVPNPRCLSFHFATVSSCARFMTEARPFAESQILFNITDREAKVGNRNLLVSPCFDIDEVEKFLSRPMDSTP